VRRSEPAGFWEAKIQSTDLDKATMVTGETPVFEK